MRDSKLVTGRSLHQAWLLLDQWASLETAKGEPLYDAYAEAVLLLLGAAYRSLYMELAAACGYTGGAATLSSVCEALAIQGTVSPELAELQRMEKSSSYWLHAMLNARVRYDADIAVDAIAFGGGIDPVQCDSWYRQLHELTLRLREASAQW
ncbi:DUF6586 family protein [Aestuariirhabdus sp. LZHN29]|uniref:DUF6586 family protein n=1 Tax=Aestuariirhabdus sp. LZHN29 TaxID=3417462 RepID=UPI003CEF97A8